MKSYLPLLSLLVLLFSCSNSDKVQPKEVLNKVPFKGLTDSIKQFPENPDLYMQRAVLLSQNNLHELASLDYKKGWELKPEEPVALQYVANLMLTNKPAQAVELLKQCITKWPDNPDLRRRLSEIYAEVGEVEIAVAEYDELLKKDSTNFEAWYEKGILMAKAKDTPAALVAMENSYRLQPINYNGLALASLYLATHNAKVLTICDELIAKDTTGITNDIMYLKGSYYSDNKQYAEARQLFDECIRRDWKFTDAYIEKGIIYFEQKQFDSSLKTFVMAATVAQTNADAYFWMARSYEQLGQKDKALLNYQRAVALDRNFDEARQGIERVEK